MSGPLRDARRRHPATSPPDTTATGAAEHLKRPCAAGASSGDLDALSPSAPSSTHPAPALPGSKSAIGASGMSDMNARSNSRQEWAEGHSNLTARGNSVDCAARSLTKTASVFQPGASVIAVVRTGGDQFGRPATNSRLRPTGTPSVTAAVAPRTAVRIIRPTSAAQRDAGPW